MTAAKFLETSRRNALGLIGFGAFSVSIPVAGAFAQAPTGEAAKLRALLERSDAAASLLDPLSAVRKIGDAAPRGPAFVDPLSDAYWSQLKANKTREWQALQAIDRNELPPIDRVAYDVFTYKLRLDLALFEDDLFEVQRMAPFNPSFGLQVEFPDFVSGGTIPFETVADYDRNLERMDGFAAYLSNAVKLAEHGLDNGYRQPRILVENVLKQVDAMLATPVEESPF